MGGANFLSGPDPRWRREVDEDIEAELDFHLAAKTSELTRDGWTPEQARKRAEEAFGNVARVRRACRKERIGERILLHRVLAAAVIVLSATAALLGAALWSSQVQAREDSARRDYEAERDREERNVLGVRVQDLHEEVDRLKSAQPPLVSESGSRVSAAPVDGDRARSQPASSLDDWRASFEQFDAGDDLARCEFAGGALARGPAEAAVEIATKLYPRLPSAKARMAFLGPLVQGQDAKSPLALLDLAARDGDATMRAWACTHLVSYAFEDFVGDPARYRAWRSEFEGRPVGEVVRTCAQRYFDRLQRLSGAELVAALDLFQKVDVRIAFGTDDNASSVLRNAGAWSQLALWLELEDVNVRVHALRWAERIGADDDLLREVIRPALRAPRTQDERTFGELCHVYATSGRPEALTELDALARQFLPSAQLRTQTDDGPLRSAVRAIGETRLVRAIPMLLSLLAERDERGMRELVGQALQELTGVQADPTHDIPFWRDWWARNAATGLPEELRAADFPGRRR
jgi:hypothetical protein